MSDETPGAGPSALPPREGLVPRPVRLTQVAGGQYVLTSQPHSVPALTQISGMQQSTALQQGIIRITSISPSRNQTSPLRPSLTNQSIVKALATKVRQPTNVRLQLFPNAGDASNPTTPTTRSPLKRSLPPTPEKKDNYPAKLQRVMNHRNVRSKIVREKYNDHLLEAYHLEIGGNILDLYQFAKRPKTQQFLTYIKEHSIDPKDPEPTPPVVAAPTLPPPPPPVPLTPIATAASSLPGISSTPTSSLNNSLNVTQTPENVSNLSIKSINSSALKVKTPIGYPATTNNQEQIVEKAKQEAYVVQRISDLQKEGLWSERRLPKIQEQPRAKAHWDFLLEEMVWLAADFAQERKWKKAAAKKCARMVQKYFQDKALAAQKAEKSQEQHIRRVAAFCAKEIKNFWSNVEKLVEYKQNTRLEEKRKKALDQHLSFIVDQTEKYSQLLAEGMNKPVVNQEPPKSTTSSNPVSRVNSDDEFKPDENSDDDEETIAQEEAADTGEKSEEIAALLQESQMDFDDFLSELPKDYLQNRDKIRLSDSESSETNDLSKPEASTSKTKTKKFKKDMEFTADSSSEDDEDTIQEQEKEEGSQNHEEEIDDLNAEAEMDIEELKKKYANLPDVDEDADEDDDADDSEEEEEARDEESDEFESENETELDESDEEDEDSEENKVVSEEVGLKSLLDDSKEGETTKTDDNNDLDDAAAIAESIQPKGNTLSSTSVVTPVPFLLKLPLREYQHIGLDWLVTMFERKLNGILADEMGLGKTIQTIALLAHLACEKENWGPHLIIVPTSVMLNWEMECKKWCPGFKILTYYGTQKERKLKRTGWTKPNAFHICITSYKLVIQDHQSFRRKKWKYLILDEAQNIKNFKSQRWQLLLNFQTQQRLLLTGTPLQNNLMELWSLMHFLMPNVFQSHREFKEWFSNPVTGMIEGNNEYNENIIKRLHKVLRPFLLRRLKSEVEKQMPKKYEHVVMCRLSKRQRFLYDDYMSRAKTRETLASGNLLSVINVLMQLRKVCNHPNLFEVRPTISPFHCDGIVQHIPSMVYAALGYNLWNNVDLNSLNLNLLQLEFSYSAYQCYRLRHFKTPKRLIEEIDDVDVAPPCPPCRLGLRVHRNSLCKEDRKPNIIETSPPQKLASFKDHQATMKAIHAAASANANSGSPSSGNAGSAVSLTSVLKPTAVPGFAQLVQTPTGKKILLTPSSSIHTQSLGFEGTTTVMTSSGQKLTVLSKKPVSTIASNSPTTSMAKAVVQVQLTSIASTGTSSTNASEDELMLQESIMKKTVGSKFIENLYAQAKPKSLDVRWDDLEDDDKEMDSDDDYLDDEDIINIPTGTETENRARRLDLLGRINDTRCNAVPIYGKDFVDGMKVLFLETKNSWSGGMTQCLNAQFGLKSDTITDCLNEIIYNPVKRIVELKQIFNRYIVYVPSAHAPEPELQVWNPPPSVYWGRIHEKRILAQHLVKPTTPLHEIASAMVTQFPHPRLIQYDCGKLQLLDKLLRKLKYGGHRALIFTQMTKMLDVLEAFLNFHGHIYLRLDGSTKIDQRQILMERFNGDTRIFAFILSTRSGGVGVNLTGADTVIFYDSDWNPTMDAQAQDRCHRIGQTRDVHIYRLVSEMTIEENILKKANQKRLLGDLAIEGGNFTTAYFKSSTIQDLFNIDETAGSAANRMSEVVTITRERAERRNEDASPIPTGEEKAAMNAMESALAAAEDDQDVIAARTAKAEAVADLAEFDENIPLDDQNDNKEPEMSKAEQEVENLVKQLSPIERYAMKFIEETEAVWSEDQLKAAEREIENQKREWEEKRLAAMKEEEERRARELEEENDIITFSRDDATNQIWVSNNTMEQMPMWCPPTPPQQDGDMYVDQTMAFLYDSNTVMSEAQLPPVYVKKDVKRTRHEAGLVDTRRAMKVHRKDEASTFPPRSLFERPSPALVKMRRDLKLAKYRGIVRAPVPIPGMKFAATKPAIDPVLHEWSVHEDMALLKVIQSFQGLPLNLTIISPGHTPNWDFVADYVNTVSITYRSPKQCRNRYETVLVPREEGKHVMDTSSPRKKKNKGGNNVYKFPVMIKSNRPMRTSQLFSQDNNATFTQFMIQRYDALKSIAVKKTTTTKTVVTTAMLKNPKHASILAEAGIDLDHPVLPVDVAARRIERVAREKKTLTPEQLLVAQKLQMQLRAAQNAANAAAAANASSPAMAGSPQPQISTVQVATVSNVTTNVIATPNTPPNTLRTQRIVASPLQNPTVVSVSGFGPQIHAGTQRLIVSGTPTKTVVGGTTVAGKTISPAQLQMIRQATMKQQQLRLQSGGVASQGGLKTTTVTIAGQTAVQVQFTQAQPRTQFIQKGIVTTKQGFPRTVTEGEMQQLLKKQAQLQQAKQLAAAANAGGGGLTTTIQSINPQVFAQAIQAGPSGQVATLVKAVSSSGVTQTVIGTPIKTIGQGMKGTTTQQLRSLQLQQQLLAQKKLANQKITSIGIGKGGVVNHQLIVGSKPLSMQQFQQVIRSPLNVGGQGGPVVLAKGPTRVIPVNTSQGNKPTIQVVAATSQGITTTLRPQTSSTLAGALAGIKVQGGVGTSSAQLLSQVSAAFQSQGVRHGSPVRLQTSSGQPIVAVTVQNNNQLQQQQQANNAAQSTDKHEQA